MVSTAGKVMSFIIPGVHGSGRLQRFEWQRSDGAEVSLLGVKKGWKLVWVDANSFASHDGDASTKTKDAVIAVAGCGPEQYVISERGGGGILEDKKLFSLMFMKPGLTEDLGEGWEVMVIITWLGLWAKILDGKGTWW